MNEVNKPVVVVLTTIFFSQLILFILKMTRTLNWGWGWILAPLWVPYVIIIVFGIITALVIFINNIKERNSKEHE